MITVTSMGDATASMGKHSWVGSRLGLQHIGVDPCWCRPAKFRGATRVIINVSWS